MITFPLQPTIQATLKVAKPDLKLAEGSTVTLVRASLNGLLVKIEGTEGRYYPVSDFTLGDSQTQAQSIQGQAAKAKRQSLERASFFTRAGDNLQSAY